MTLRAYGRLLRRRWWIVAAGALVGALTALGITLILPPQFTAHSFDFVAIGSTGSAAESSLYQTSQFALQRVGSYTEIVNSPEVLQPVIDELGLKESVADLRQRVDAANPVNTVLLDVAVTDPTAAGAQRVANAVAQQLGTVIEELETPRGATNSPVKVTNAIPAPKPVAPVSPKSKLNLILGFVAGLAAGVVAAVLREQFDTSVKAEDIVAITGRSTLGLITRDPRIAAHPLAALELSGRRVEEFRTVRNNLRFVDVDEPPRLILVTSAVPNEGKTTFACNLAITLAQSAQKVCLIEADLRRPRANEYMGLDGTVGLSNVLAGEHALDDVVIPWHDGMLSVLPAGTAPPDPSRLLGSHMMQGLVDELRERFDVVVFDAPPILPVTDALVLSKVTDGAIFVARVNRTKREHVQRALDALASAGVHTVGTVLTFMPPLSRRKTKANRYAYTYGSLTDPSDPENLPSAVSAALVDTTGGPDDADGEQPAEVGDVVRSRGEDTARQTG